MEYQRTIGYFLPGWYLGKDKTYAFCGGNEKEVLLAKILVPVLG